MMRFTADDYLEFGREIRKIRYPYDRYIAANLFCRVFEKGKFDRDKFLATCWIQEPGGRISILLPKERALVRYLENQKGLEGETLYIMRRSLEEFDVYVVCERSRYWLPAWALQTICRYTAPQSRGETFKEFRRLVLARRNWKKVQPPAPTEDAAPTKNDREEA